MPSLGLLLEESSSLPIFIAKYHGSLLDIKTFCATIDDMPLFSYFNYKVVIDEGFYSAKNINWLLKERLNFLIEIPAQPSNNDYLALNNLTLDISEENILKIGHDFLAYKTLTYDWNYKNKLFVHLFFNKFENTCEICKLLYKTEDMRIKASKNPDKYIDDEEFKKYLDFDENINNKKQIDINVKEEIINSIVHKGRLVLLTNVIDDASSALTVYRNKTVLEEAFNRINNYLELFNLKSEGDFMVEAKLLISFLSLIFVSYTFKKMVNTDLDKKFTIQEVFSELNLVKRVIIKNKIINFPLTGLQKSIFKKLDCPLSF
jgi:transposase